MVEMNTRSGVSRFPTMQAFNPTQQDVAHRAGVNKSTVSRVLRGNGEVAAETRERVLTAARDLGYRLDPALSRIAALRWQKPDQRRGQGIAFIERGARATHEEVRGGVMRQAEALGYGVDCFEMAHYRSGASLSSVLDARGIHSAVLVGFCDTESLDGLAVPGRKLVHCGAVDPGFPGCVVLVDPAAKLEQIWRAARWGRGRRIGLVLGADGRSRYPQLLLEGYHCKMQQSREGTVAVPTCALPNQNREEATRQVSRWWVEHRPDLVILQGPAEAMAWQEFTRNLEHAPPAIALELGAGGGEVRGYHAAGAELGAQAVLNLHLHYLAGGLQAVPKRILIPPRWGGPGALSTWVNGPRRTAAAV